MSVQTLFWFLAVVSVFFLSVYVGDLLARYWRVSREPWSSAPPEVQAFILSGDPEGLEAYQRQRILGLGLPKDVEDALLAEEFEKAHSLMDKHLEKDKDCVDSVRFYADFGMHLSKGNTPEA